MRPFMLLQHLWPRLTVATRPHSRRGAVYMKSVGRGNWLKLYRFSLQGRSNRVQTCVWIGMMRGEEFHCWFKLEPASEVRSGVYLCYPFLISFHEKGLVFSILSLNCTWWYSWMDLIGALVHFTSFDAKFQFGNEEETKKDCYYSLGKVASGHT